MVGVKRQRFRWIATIAGVCLVALATSTEPASALTPLPTPDPIPGAYGLAAVKVQDPPAQGATITTPGNGSSFTNSPITVSGICPSDLLVQVYNNGVMAGAIMCADGSFSLEVSLFAGINELSATVYDDLEQSGPTSNVVSVNYTDSNLSAFGQLITLTSAYGRRSTPANTELNWPLQLTGGTGPYAFSIDWGDGSSAELKSQSLAGVVSINRVYKKAGIYQVNVRVSDANNVGAFLQVIAVSSGKVDDRANAANASGDTPSVRTVIIWIPAAIALILLIPTYWLGRRSQLVSLHNKMLKERDAYQDD